MKLDFKMLQMDDRIVTNFQSIYSYVYVTTSKSFFFVLRARVTGL